jgi:biopolymer transport protein ExbB/TolQ
VNRIQQLISDGGPVIFVIIGLSVLLYSRCFQLLAFLLDVNRKLRAVPAESAVGRRELRWRREELEEAFRQQRLPIVAMIAAAPLCGLLGTVMGMVQSFASLSRQSDRHSMESLAQGISEVLVDTESGLAVAIPALLLLSLAHGVLHHTVHRIHLLESGSIGPA